MEYLDLTRMPDRLESSDLTLLAVITLAGSLSRASEQLNISQPTLSKRLQRLERKLGTPLFHRSANGMTATDTARYLLEAGSEVTAELKKLERHVELSTNHQIGEVRIGVGPIVEQVLLPDVLTEFVKSTGAVRLDVITEDADTLLAALRSADVDLIAGPFIAQEHPDLTAIPLVSDRLIDVVRSGHPLLKKTGRKRSEFPVAAPKPQGSVQATGSPQGNAAWVASDNYDVLKRLTLASDCIASGPRGVFSREIERGELCALPSRRPPSWTSAALVRPESAQTPLIELLLNLFKQASAAYQR